MPKFQYAGVTAEGGTAKGVVTADHPNDARLMLADRVSTGSRSSRVRAC